MNTIALPEIQTNRLLLRKIVESDSSIILFLRSDERINKYIERPENRKTKNIADAINHIKKINAEAENNSSFSWGITLQNHPEIMGSICLWNFSKDRKIAEVGYDLIPKHQNKGIMSEALASVLDFGFSKLDVDKIEAFTHAQNQNSIKLLEKNGFNVVPDKKDMDNLSNLIFEIKKDKSIYE